MSNIKFSHRGFMYFSFFVLCVCRIFFSTDVMAADPDPLQDFCVADLKNKDVIVNGFPCKNPNDISGADFFFRGLAKPGNTSNPVGSKVTPVTVQQLPGLNTLGVSVARIDYAPGGTNPPHTHPRATEVVVLLEGTLFCAFITTNDTLVGHQLQKGDVFVFPRGLVHFQLNTGHVNAAVISGFNSQLPGVQVIANSVFGSKPPIPDEVLTKAFQIDQKLVHDLQLKLSARTK